MASHIFHELFIHLNWHTRENQALLNEKLEPKVHEFLDREAWDTKGIYFHGVRRHLYACALGAPDRAFRLPHHQNLSTRISLNF